MNQQQAGFPEPLALSKDFSSSRKNREKVLLYSATRSLFFRFGLCSLQLAGAFLFRQKVLFADAGASGIDVLSSFVLLWALRHAHRPPDRSHPLGHGRFEPVVGLLLNLLMIALGVGGIAYLLSTPLTPREPLVGNLLFACVVPFISIVFFEMMARYLEKVAKGQKSIPLRAEAYHYRIDALSSLIAFITVLSQGIFPHLALPLVDLCGALGIAVAVTSLGVVAAKGNINQLLDASPKKQYYELVRSAAEKVEGVFETEKLYIQAFGPDAYVSIDVEVSPDLTVEKAHRISQEVRREIQESWPRVRDVLVHIEPYYPNDHSHPYGR